MLFLLLLGVGFLFGLAATLVVLASAKKITWRKSGWLIGLSLLLGLAGLGGSWWLIRPSESNDGGQYAAKLSRPRAFQLQKINQVATGDDDLTLQTDDQGQYTLYLKGLANGTVRLKDDDDESSVRFKTQQVAVKKVTKLTVTLPESESQHQFELVDSFGHDTDFQLVRPSAPAATASSSQWESK